MRTPSVPPSLVAISWVSSQRDVAADFKRLFGTRTAPRPGYIMLWSDSDNTHAVSDVYFDNIELLPARN